MLLASSPLSRPSDVGDSSEVLLRCFQHQLLDQHSVLVGYVFVGVGTELFDDPIGLIDQLHIPCPPFIYPIPPFSDMQVEMLLFFVVSLLLVV